MLRQFPKRPFCPGDKGKRKILAMFGCHYLELFEKNVRSCVWFEVKNFEKRSKNVLFIFLNYCLCVMTWLQKRTKAFFLVKHEIKRKSQWWSFSFLHPVFPPNVSDWDRTLVCFPASVAQCSFP